MKNLKLVVMWLSLLTILLSIIFVTVYRFINPDMSETRLFINLWPLSLGIIIPYIGFKWGQTYND